MVKQPKFLIKMQRLLNKIRCPRYLHHFGPKKYEFVQHFAALLIKESCKMSFRRIQFWLVEFGFEAPTYSALCKMRKRIPLWIWNSLLKLTAEVNFNVAVDSTGFSRTNPSFHYIKRIDSKNPVKSYVKLSAFFCIDNRKFIALKVRAKPRHDVMDFDSLFRQNHSFKNLFADSAYDSEKIHEKLYWSGIQTIIKPRKNVRKGFFRKKQMNHYSDELYHQRSLIEAGWSSLKRKYGGSTLAKNYRSSRAEIYCKATAYNLSLQRRDFQQSPGVT